MKNIAISTLIFIANFLFLNVSQANEKIFTAKGYPYNLLISRTNSVKIIYTENANKVSCIVKIDRQGKQRKTQPLTVSLETFNQAPLASCLPRTQAKEFLSWSFS